MMAVVSLLFYTDCVKNYNFIVILCFRQCMKIIIYNSTCTDHKMIANFSRIYFQFFCSGCLCVFPYIVDTASCAENNLHCYNQIGNFMD